MSRFFSRFDKTYFILVPVVLYATWPWFAYRFRAMVPFLTFLLWCCFQRNSTRVFYQRRNFVLAFGVTLTFFLLTSFLRNIFALFGHAQFCQWHEYGGPLLAFSHFIVIYISLKEIKFREIEFLTIVALIGTSLAGIAAMRGGMIEDFEGSRTLTSATDLLIASGNFDDAVLAHQLGMAGYGATYGFAAFAGPLLWAVFKAKAWKVRCLVLASFCSCVLTVRNSGLGTPVFVFILSCGLATCAIFGLRKKGITIIGMVAVILLIAFAYGQRIFTPFASAVSTLGSAFSEGSSIQRRCESVAESFEGDQDSYAFQRYQLQRRSIEAFLEHPIFGVGIYRSPHPKAYEAGGHSHLLDRLGQAGMIGGILYFGFLMALYRYYRQMTVCFGFPRQWLVLPQLCIMVYVFICVANPIPSFPGILYFSPGLLLLTLKENGKNVGSGDMGYAQAK